MYLRRRLCLFQTGILSSQVCCASMFFPSVAVGGARRNYADGSAHSESPSSAGAPVNVPKKPRGRKPRMAAEGVSATASSDKGPVAVTKTEPSEAAEPGKAPSPRAKGKRKSKAAATTTSTDEGGGAVTGEAAKPSNAKEPEKKTLEETAAVAEAIPPRLVGDQKKKLKQAAANRKKTVVTPAKGAENTAVGGAPSAANEKPEEREAGRSSVQPTTPAAPSHSSLPPLVSGALFSVLPETDSRLTRTPPPVQRNNRNSGFQNKTYSSGNRSYSGYQRGNSQNFKGGQFRHNANA